MLASRLKQIGQNDSPKTPSHNCMCYVRLTPSNYFKHLIYRISIGLTNTVVRHSKG